MKIQRALISVSDKTELIPFAQMLQKWNIEIISTGGTAKFLQEHQVPVTSLSEVTNFPEIMDGRVKTLHPRIFAGILGVRSNQNHLNQMREHQIQPIDLVVVNLYPFEEQAIKGGLGIDESIEWIDIGGPSLIRAAAKNHAFVTVITDPEDYAAVAEEMDKQEGSVSEEMRRRLAVKAFTFTSYYDATIAGYYLSKAPEPGFPAHFPIGLKLSANLRYGENPHQKGALYTSVSTPGASLAKAQKVQGKELSFNNLLDFDAAFQLSCALKQPSAVIIKHNNPCGVALDPRISEAYRKARAADPLAAFGGIVSINGVVDEETAQIISEAFIEGVLAKDFTPQALSILSKKTGMRLLKLAEEWVIQDSVDLKKIIGGALIQDRDNVRLDRETSKVVTKRQPSDKEWKGLEFAWIVAQYVKSNAIVFANETSTVGVGAGQMSRVDSVKIARLKAQSSLKGTVVASDAFFPFRDGVDEIADAGATAIIQPGGSIRDQEVFDAANEHLMAMVVTGSRHFRH
jgi:phosphoribosylaminoimidazolecarboxamide formyltransferase / IMP cyclohydrolase